MMDSSGKKEKRKFRCYSPNCGGKEVSEASFYRHKKRRKILEDSNASKEVIGQEEFLDDSIVEEVTTELDGVDFVDAKIPTPVCTNSTLESAMRTQMVLLQSDMDLGKVPVALQEKIMRRVFSEKPSTCFNSMSIGQLFTHAGSIGEEMNIPTSYDQLLKDYEQEGMSKPIRWRVCTGSIGIPHTPQLLSPSPEDLYEGPCVVKCDCENGPRLRRNCKECGEKCSLCNALRRDILPFDYLPIARELEHLSSSRTRCHEFLEYWRKKSKWRGISPEDLVSHSSEIWDGSKFKKNQAFWDPEQKWELPVKCSNITCKEVFRAFPTPCQELLGGWNATTQEYAFDCSSCFTPITSKKSFAQGDPRNYALAGHWDGFLTATTKFKDTWVVEMEVLNGGKNNSLGPIPLIFIPASSKQIIKDSEDHILTSFLEPLIHDLELIFIEGFAVKYNYPPHLISSSLPATEDEKVTLRGMLMLWTGDHPAQTKIGGLKDKGYNACRRCVMIEGLYGRSVVYPDTRRQACHPPPLRTMEGLMSEVHKLGAVDSRHICVTGISKLWRLYYLYEFDMSLDLVYDVMHILPLCIFKKYVLKLKEDCHSRGVLLEKALGEVSSHRPNDLGARWPSGITDRFGYWKAEEFVLFIQWCLPYVLDRMGYEKTHELCLLGLLLIEICRLFFNHTRSHGWTLESMTIGREYLAAWRVRWEEYYGPNGSILEHVAGNGELFDDISRHGSHDIFWCFRHERKVSSYVNIKTNKKENELTYAAYHARTSYTSLYKQKDMDLDLLYPPERAIHSLHSNLMTSASRQCLQGSYLTECPLDHLKGCFITSSKVSAMDLWKLRDLLPNYPCKEMLKRKGVSVGWKHGNKRVMLKTVKSYLMGYWRGRGLLTEETMFEFKDEVERLSFLLHEGTKYRLNDLVVIRPDGVEESEAKDLGYWTWKGKIVSIFMHEFLGVHEIFFRAEYFEQLPKSEGSNEALQSDLSFMRVLKSKPKQHFGDDTRPVHMLLHKFMVHPIPNRKDVFIAYELCDLSIRFHLLSQGHRSILPPWPEVGELYWFEEIEGSGRYKVGVVRKVTLPTHLQTMEENEEVYGDPNHPYIGLVYLSALKGIAGKHGQFTASVKASPYSWRCLGEYVISNYIVTKFSKGVPVTWEGV